MKHACTDGQKIVFTDAPSFEIMESHVEKDKSKGLTYDAVMRKEQAGYQHIKAHFGDVI